MATRRRRPVPRSSHEAGARLLDAVETIADELIRLRKIAEQQGQAGWHTIAPNLAEIAAQLMDRMVRGR